MKSSLPARIPFCLLLAFSPLAAQEQVHKIDGPVSNGEFGTAVAMGGDVDGDWRDDFIVGAPFDDSGPNGGGAAYVYSGETGQLLYALYGDWPGAEFGSAVAFVEDTNGDGIGEWLVGAPFAQINNNTTGAARLFSGADGSELVTLVGELPDDEFGWSVNDAGDITGDGLSEFIIGAPLADLEDPDGGRAYVFDGSDYSTVYIWSGDRAGDEFGWSVDGAGDVDGDGIPDLVVGARSGGIAGSLTGRVVVLSGADGRVIYTWDGEASNDRFGVSVAGLGDVDGDQVPDIAVGATKTDFTGNDVGSAYVFSGATGLRLYRFDGTSDKENFGRWVEAAGDVDLDGDAEIFVGAYKNDEGASDAGKAFVYDGGTGSPLYQFLGENGSDQFGYALSGGGDLDGDGFPDVLVGARWDDDGGTDAGSVYAWRSDGMVLSIDGVLAGETRTLSVIRARADSQVNFVYDFNQGTFAVGPFCPGAFVDMQDPKLIQWVDTNPDGTASVSFPVPGSAASVRVLFQAVDVYACRVSPLLIVTFG